MKTSVYLERSDADHLAWLAEVERRPQAEIVRDAIRQYRWAPAERRFHIFEIGEGEGGPRGDGRAIADIPEDELMEGFGEDAWSEPE